jgi:hypothetical protein
MAAQQDYTCVQPTLPDSHALPSLAIKLKKEGKVPSFLMNMSKGV